MPIFEYSLINFIFSALLAGTIFIIMMYFYKASKKASGIAQKKNLKLLTYGWIFFWLAYTFVSIRVLMWPYYWIDNLMFKIAASLFAIGIIPIMKLISEDVLGKNNFIVLIWTIITISLIVSIFTTTQERILDFYGSEWIPNNLVSSEFLFDFGLTGIVFLIILSYHAVISEDEQIGNKMLNLGILFFLFFILTFYEGSGLGSDLLFGWGFIINRILIALVSYLIAVVWFEKKNFFKKKK